ncbi:MAG: DUF1194 domain-containing protein [Minwuia sp.]|uniref:DUF1194 domain-containing protein n=1 Tax=Minwuia sp. TaxID=2493630 RepID=UPI003A8B0D02
MLLPILSAAQAPAAAQAVDVAIVLAVDASASVDAGEFRLQMEGTADALENPDVLAAIARGNRGAIAVSTMQWSTLDQQAVTLGWTVIRDASDAAAAASVIRNAPRMVIPSGTALGDAVSFAMGMLGRLPYSADRLVVDVSGDGKNVHPPLLLRVKERAVWAGITINGLPIISADPNIHYYYQDTVIAGPGAFIEIADSYEVFGEAMRRKLIREIKGPPPVSMLAD